MPKIKVLFKPTRRLYSLATPYAMLEKLGWEIENLKMDLKNQSRDPNHLNSMYHAFSAVITAWDLAALSWGSMSKVKKVKVSQELRMNNVVLDEFQNALKSRSDSLKVSEVIANGLINKGDASRNASLIWKSIAFNTGLNMNKDTDESSTDKYKLIVRNNGLESDALDLFDDVYNFWSQKLMSWGFMKNNKLIMDHTS